MNDSESTMDSLQHKPPDEHAIVQFGLNILLQIQCKSG